MTVVIDRNFNGAVHIPVIDRISTTATEARYRIELTVPKGTQINVSFSERKLAEGEDE